MPKTFVISKDFDTGLSMNLLVRDPSTGARANGTEDDPFTEGAGDAARIYTATADESFSGIKTVEAIDTSDGSTRWSVLMDTTGDGPHYINAEAMRSDVSNSESSIRGADSDTLKTISDQLDSHASGQNPTLLQSTTIATLDTQVSFTLTDGSPDNDAYNGAIIIITDSATSTQKSYGKVADYAGPTKTVTLALPLGVFTISVGDTVDIIAPTGQATVTANVTPIVGAVPDRGTGTTISLFTGETIPNTVTVVDADGNAIDLTGYTSLQVVIENDDGTDVETHEGGGLTIGGTDNNQITFTNGAAVTASPGSLNWSLRDTDDNEVIQFGTIVVSYAAMADS